MPLAVSLSRYGRAARQPRYSLTFAFPLLVAYEGLAFGLSHDALAGVRNGADVMLKSVFVLLGGRNGLLVFGALLVGTGLVLAWRDRRRSGPIEGWVFVGMAIESLVYAVVFGLVVGALTGLLLRGLATAWGPAVAQVGSARLGLATQLMVSLGAGIYEELLFRVLLVGTLARGARRLLGWGSAASQHPRDGARRPRLFGVPLPGSLRRPAGARLVRLPRDRGPDVQRALPSARLRHHRVDACTVRCDAGVGMKARGKR